LAEEIFANIAKGFDDDEEEEIVNEKPEVAVKTSQNS
jgi:hypothetical protein